VELASPHRSPIFVESHLPSQPPFDVDYPVPLAWSAGKDCIFTDTSNNSINLTFNLFKEHVIQNMLTKEAIKDLKKVLSVSTNPTSASYK